MKTTGGKETLEIFRLGQGSWGFKKGLRAEPSDNLGREGEKRGKGLVASN